ncbi:hypothetical protein MCUN1_001495 [Malassezia cuniculi]|uniref:ATP-dependent bile acid permease n=1 Tax=Malassezia cuniculi TaxID=948313 RepID=A0AAF0EU71_9BASI|nr:hypothetical protein MCUN1_001495 [Malassezia cuniculi]
MDAREALAIASGLQVAPAVLALLSLARQPGTPSDLIHPKDERPVDAPAFWRSVARCRAVTAVCAAVSAVLAAHQRLGIDSVAVRVLLAALVLASLRTRGAQHLRSATYILVLSAAVFINAAITVSVGDWSDVWLWAHALVTFVAMVSTFLVAGEPPYERNGKRLAPSSSASASPLSQLFFVFCNPLMLRAWRTRKVQDDDIPSLGWTLRAAPLRAGVSARYSRFSGGARLLIVLLLSNWLLFCAVCALAVLAVFFYYLPAYCLRVIVARLEAAETNGDIHSWDTFYTVLPVIIGLCITVVTSSTIQGRLWALLDGGLTVRLTTQLTSLIYDKALRRPNVASTEGSTDAGQAVTLFAVDIRRVVAMSFHVFMITNGPFELLIGGYFAYTVIGVSALVGFAFNILLMPVLGLISARFQKANDLLMGARDKRMSLLGECLLGIYMIKSHAWEPRYADKVMKERAAELAAQRTSFLLSTLLSVMLDLNPVAVTTVAFAWYTAVLGHSLTPHVAFTTIAVMFELRWALTTMPETITNAIQTWVSLKRIQAYLDGDEVDGSGDAAVDAAVDAAAVAGGDSDEEAVSHAESASPTAAPTPLVLKGASIAYPQSAESTTRFTLDATIEFAPLSRTLVCGKLGSGKSLLLRALLHEADVLVGSVQSPRSPRDGIPATASASDAVAALLDTPQWLRADLVAYAPQCAYLVNASVRDNILFGLPYGDGSRYRAVVAACALARDLDALDHGDLTIVGENGVGLSGGQRARIGLARALYSRAGVLLMDDVLSAVDTHTAKHLVAHAIDGQFVKGRTLVLVSHHVQLVASSVDQVVYLEGGKVAFSGTGADFVDSKHFKGLLDDKEDQETPEATEAQQSTPPADEEHRATGDISGAVWMEYINAGGGWMLCTATLFLFAAANLWELLTNTWLRKWSTVAGHDVHSDAWWLNRYVLLVLAGSVLSVLRWVALYSMSLRASSNLFSAALHRVMYAPLAFHGRTSRGRLLNRFGHDFEVVDSEFARASAEVTMRVTQLVTVCIATYIVGGWQFLVAIGALAPAYSVLGRAYVIVSRDLQRLISTSRSPIVGAINDAVSGALVVRAFGAQRLLTMRMLGYMDNNNRFLWWNNQVGRWASQSYNLVSAVLLFASSVLVLTSPALSAASAGFAFTFLIELNFSLLISMRMYTALQLSGVAVERVVEYANDIEQEKPAIDCVEPPVGWPAAGHISVEDLVVRYSPDGRDILRSVSLDIPAGHKLGIVGATGSGKSTLAGAFFRFVEARSGRIVIDGVDISQLSLADLRSRLELVPQDPVITSGPLRATLDVLGVYDDAALYDVLRQVHLLGSETEEQSLFFSSLDNVVAEGGANLSQGQRQLVCLARAILHKAHVVLFDEASSSIDLHTDELITQTIRSAFAGSTVLTIAHRLRTIIDYDSVLVLGNGSVLEIGEPHQLLQNTRSHFYALCQSAGRTELAYLQAAAAAASAARAN